jgi:predicted amidohydrolase
VVADIDKDALAAIRQRMPVFEHRRLRTTIG